MSACDGFGGLPHLRMSPAVARQSLFNRLSSTTSASTCWLVHPARAVRRRRKRSSSAC